MLAKIFFVVVVNGWADSSRDIMFPYISGGPVIGWIFPAHACRVGPLSVGYSLPVHVGWAHFWLDIICPFVSGGPVIGWIFPAP
jgi:hypothetical protein